METRSSTHIHQPQAYPLTHQVRKFVEDVGVLLPPLAPSRALQQLCEGLHSAFVVGDELGGEIQAPQECHQVLAAPGKCCPKQLSQRLVAQLIPAVAQQDPQDVHLALE